MSKLETYLVYSDKTMESSEYAVRATSPEHAVEIYLREAIEENISVDIEDIGDNKLEVVHLPALETPGVLHWHGPDIRQTIEFMEILERLENEMDARPE